MRNKRFSPELRERAVRMVLDHRGQYESEYQAILSIAEKIGCSPEALRRWIRRSEAKEQAGSGDLNEDERTRLKRLERENLELRRANEILRKASAYFAQAELDRHEK